MLAYYGYQYAKKKRAESRAKAQGPYELHVAPPSEVDIENSGQYSQTARYDPYEHYDRDARHQQQDGQYQPNDRPQQQSEGYMTDQRSAPDDQYLQAATSYPPSEGRSLTKESRYTYQRPSEDRLSDDSANYQPPDDRSSTESLIKPPPYASRLDLASADIEGRDPARTPSPTPEEAEFLAEGGIKWEKLKDWRFWTSKAVLLRLLLLTVLIAISVLTSIFHNQLVRWFQPTANKIKDLPAGWVIPAVILVIISFPPLFGQEIIIMLCGIIWGLWIGFAIVTVGTVLGEVANYYVFRYACITRASKYENKSLRYACFAELVRTGGFKTIVIARFSILPSHFTTVIFAACQVSFLQFLVAVFLSLPKQLALVFIGVDYEESSTGEETKTAKITSTVIVIVTGFVTYIAFRYLIRQVAGIKGDVVYKRRKARQVKLSKARAFQSQSSVTLGGVYAPQPRVAPEMASVTEEGRYDQPMQSDAAASSSTVYASVSQHDAD